MSLQSTSIIDYLKFVQKRDKKVRVARLDDPKQSTAFSFDDDVWPLLNLLKPHERNYVSNITFNGVPRWLREDAKKYIAHLWLETHSDAMALQIVMVAIRRLGALLPDFKGRPIELRMRHARDFRRRLEEERLSPATNKNLKNGLNRFMVFVRGQHPEDNANDFEVILPKSMVAVRNHVPLEKSMESKVPAEIISAIIDACAAEVRAYHEAKLNYIDPVADPNAYGAWWHRERRRRIREGLEPRIGMTAKMWMRLAGAIKAQAVVLAICTGRRPAAICNAEFDIRVREEEWENGQGQKEKVVLLRFVERKGSNCYEEVACPGAFGELALKAIATAKELTAELRRNNPQLKKLLFIVPTGSMRRAAVLSPGQLNGYLSGEYGSGGLLQRY